MADISTITASNGTTYNIKDSTARSTLIPKDTNGNTSNLRRPLQLNGVGDLTLDGKIDEIRANRLAFLPADQIIVEQTTDGGTTWTDAGVSDNGKLGIFSQTNTLYAINIPAKNGVRSIDCGVRITFTAMKYDVPSGTAETNKYNYWNSSYVLSSERYCRLKEMYFFVSAVADGIGITVQRAKGNDSNNWSTIYSNSSYAMTGWSGPDYVRFLQDTFGGATNQVGQFWNYRLILMTRGADGGTTLSTSSTTTKQFIARIKGYGDAVWTSGNNLMVNDHLYSWDINKNVTFPAKVSANNLPSAPIKIYTSLTGTAAVTTSPYYCARYDVTDSSVTEYTNGMMVSIRVPVAGSGTYGTALQINSLGYKPIVHSVNSMISTRYGVGAQITAVYNSTQTATLYLNSSSASTVTGCWQVCDYDSNDPNYAARTYYGTPKLSSASAYTLYRMQIVLPLLDGTYVPYSNGNNAPTTYTKTINTTNAFNPFGIIYFFNYSSTSTVAAGGNIFDAYLNYQYSNPFDLRYAMNINSSGTAGTTALTGHQPVYIKAKYNYNTRTAVLVPNSSSSNYLEKSSIVQVLPSSNPDTALTADETYIYIYIGHAHDKYRIGGVYQKTVYNWDAVNNCIQVFDGNRPEAVVFVNQSSTFSQIFDIKQKGKIPIYKDSDGFAFPEQVEDSSPSGFTFTKATDTGTIVWYKVDAADAWTSGTKSIADEKVRLTSTTTDASYPLALAPSNITTGSSVEENYNSNFNVNPSTATMNVPKLIVNPNNENYNQPLEVRTKVTSDFSNKGVAKFVNNTTTSASTTWLAGFDILAPNLTASSNISYGNFAAYNFGRAKSALNCGNLAFHYAGSGSSSNFMSFGFHSHDHILTVGGTERVGIKNTAPAYPLDVTGTIHTTSGIKIGSENEIKSIGTGLSIDANGALNASGGGGHSTTYYAQNQSVSSGSNVAVTAPTYYEYGQYFVDITGYIYSTSRTTRVYLKPTSSAMDCFYGEILDVDSGNFKNMAVTLTKVSSTSYTYRVAEQSGSSIQAARNASWNAGSHTLTNFGVAL